MDFQTLNQLLRCSIEYNHRKIRMRELSDTECMICTFVYSNENCAQDEVAASLKTNKTTVAKAVAELEKRGCLTRTQDSEDRRKKRLCLTETGRAKILDLLHLHDNWLSEILTTLSTEEQKQFEDYCNRLLAAAEELAKNQNQERIRK